VSFCLSSSGLDWQKRKQFRLSIPGGPQTVPFPLPLLTLSPPSPSIRPPPRIYLAASARRPPTVAGRRSRPIKFRGEKFGGVPITEDVEQNVQVPQGGGRGIRIGPQGLPLHHRRALRLRLGLMDAPPRKLQGTRLAPFSPLATLHRGQADETRIPEEATVSLARFIR
jgi:hypothetical protein